MPAMTATRRESIDEAPHVLASLLAIDDDAESLELIQSALERTELSIRTISDPQAGLELVHRLRPTIVLLDLRMPQMDGMKVLEEIVEFDPSIEVILMTAHYSTESAVQAIQKGAADYLNKPVDITKLRERIARVLDAARLRERAAKLDAELLTACQFEGIVGRSPLMLEVFARIRRVAPHFRSVLITGATGTGKELAARALHQLSPSVQDRFVVCNCSAVVETLFESELFGHVKGAFTGATQDKVGLIELAHTGTLFLDEIGEMPLSTQAKLLRVLQNQEIQRVGSVATKKIDVRVIIATNRDLRTMVAKKEFRDDLFFRLSMVEIELPRLADRKEDLPLLQRHFTDIFGRQFSKPVRGISPRAQIVLNHYPWPGNVRELENAIGHGVMMANGDTVDVKDLPEHLRSRKVYSLLDDERMLPLEELERRHVLRVLERMNGNKIRAAEVLGIGRTTLYRILGENTAEPRQ